MTHLEAFIFWQMALREVAALRGGGQLSSLQTYPAAIVSEYRPDEQKALVNSLKRDVREHLDRVDESLARGYTPPIWWRERHAGLRAALEEAAYDESLTLEARGRAALELRDAGFPEAALFCDSSDL